MHSKNSLNDIFDFSFVNMALLSVIAVLEGLQVLIATGFIASFFPLPVNPGEFFLEAKLHLLKPEREMLLYRIFILAVIVIQAGALYIFRRRLAMREFFNALVRFGVVEIIFVGTLVAVLFKIDVFKDVAFPKYLFYILLGLAAASKMMWFEIDGLIQKCLNLPSGDRKAAALIGFLDWVVLVLIVVVIYIPDRTGAVAAMYGTDCLLHFDSFIMAPGWAVTKGCIFYVDTITQYGIGMPILISAVSRRLGGFSYEHVLLVLLGMAMIYYVLTYVVLRVWFRNIWIAIIGIALAMKFQLFNVGEVPFPWRIPSTTVVRYLFDIVVLLCVLLHARSGKKKYLLWASIAVGISLFYMNDTGIYQLAALYAYLVLLWVLPDWRKKAYATLKDTGWMALYFALPLVVYFTLLGIFIGKYLWTPLFWKNSGEFIQFFLEGFGAEPIDINLTDGHYFEFFMGLAIPLVYVLTVLFVGSLLLYKKIKRENIFVVFLGIYGLCLYNHYVCRSVLANYYIGSSPFVFIICYWLDTALGHVSQTAKRGTQAVAAFIAVFVLVTMSTFLNYPNLLNRPQNASVKNGRFISEKLLIDTDARLISRLTSAKDRVCLISSFETAMLMAADRKPFFYFFPFVHSRFLNMREFGGTYLFTKERLAKMIAQMESERPPLVFIERKLFLGEIPKIYYSHYQDLAVIVQYLRERYALYEMGQYLVALKRK